MIDNDSKTVIDVNPNISKRNDYNELPTDRVQLSNFIKDKILKIKSDKYVKQIYQKLNKVIDNYLEKEDEKMLKKENKNPLYEAPPRKREYTRADDVDGATLDQIAAEFGFAGPAGAKAALEKALRKLRFMAELPEEDRNFLILSAMDEFLEMKEKDGSFTKDDVELLRTHPDILQALDGFKEYLHKFILRGMRDAAKQNKNEDESEDMD